VSPLTGPALLAGAGLTALVVLLLVAVGVTHTTRARRSARDDQRRAQLTPLVLELLDDEDGSPAPGLASAPDLLDDVVLGLLPQLRGADRQVLQTVLTTRGVVARAARDLSARAAWRRGRAAALLGSTASRFHTAELTVLLDDRVSEVRCAAARALGKAGDPAAVGPLLTALSASRPLPAGIVGMAVLDLGTPVLPSLREALRSGAPAARVLAAEVLGLHGDLPAAATLEDIVRDRAQPDDVRRAAVSALGRIGAPSSTEALVRVLADGSLRTATAEALGRIGDPFAVPALAAGLAATDPAVRTACAGALAALGAEGRDRLAALASGSGPAARSARAALQELATTPRRASLAGVR
jgi:HEAT repeat protein